MKPNIRIFIKSKLLSILIYVYPRIFLTSTPSLIRKDHRLEDRFSNLRKRATINPATNVRVKLFEKETFLRPGSLLNSFLASLIPCKRFLRRTHAISFSTRIQCFVRTRVIKMQQFPRSLVQLTVFRVSTCATGITIISLGSSFPDPSKLLILRSQNFFANFFIRLCHFHLFDTRSTSKYIYRRQFQRQERNRQTMKNNQQLSRR